jgi:hypothetical protein
MRQAAHSILHTISGKRSYQLKENEKETFSSRNKRLDLGTIATVLNIDTKQICRQQRMFCRQSRKWQDTENEYR